MNLFGAVTGVVSAVRPRIPATLKASNGSTVNDDFSTTPQFIEVRIWIEVQALTSQDLQQVENLSQQADMRAVYIRGGIKALNRPLQCGGDIINFYGSDWLVTQSLEEWGDAEWCKVVVTRQLPQAQA
ncbi:hypothetical protein HK16_05815 [Acetobacter senegalensis]|uniref:Burkholderia phage Bcep781 gp06 n=2 Tax=Acetobacter TaxID=434 RepID=A0A252ELD8_9PROT|nr:MULTISPECIES: hypothetical protein [Acetobacter]ATJ91543.1 hypothetical protein CIW82_13420 [Acetobacter tropicalis]OUL67074.1 hypothetical protein HK16_05815 [Acetobacter senegalensis]